MYLKNLSLKNFRKFKDFFVSFPSDITIIKGPNEQGKSTILFAVLAALFYDPKKSNKAIDSFKSWNTDELYHIKAELENNGQDIFLEKDFESKSISLENKTSGKKIQTFKEVSDYLYEIGNLRSLELFEGTACVKHDALSLITEGKREISQALQSLITSPSENVSVEKIIKKIEDFITDVKKGIKQASKTPGILKDLEIKISELQQKKNKMQEDLADLASKSDHLGSLRFKYDNLKKDFDAKARQYEMNVKYFQVAQELDRLNAQLEKITSDVSVMEELDKKKEYLTYNLDQMSSLKDVNLHDLVKKKNTLFHKEKEASALQREHESQKNEPAKSKVNTHSILLYISFLFLGLGFVGFLNKMFFASWFVFAVLAGLSVVFKKQGAKSEQLKLSGDLKALINEINALKNEINSIFSGSRVKSEEELVEKIKTYNDFCQELAKMESKEEGILRGGSFENLKKERSEVLKRIAIEEEKVSKEQKTYVPSPAEQRLLEVDLEKGKGEIEKIAREISHATAAINQYSIDKENIVETEEDIDILNGKKQYYEHKMMVLESVVESLREAQAKTIAKSKQHIEDYMRKYLPIITDGRYNDIKVNDDLSFNVFSNEKNSMITPEEHLSRGTIDQFYLVARLAILDVLNKGKKSLVLLDDPFHSFDASRRAKTEQVLKDLSDRFQIVLFTHSADYDTWGKVIEI